MMTQKKTVKIEASKKASKKERVAETLIAFSRASLMKRPCLVIGRIGVARANVAVKMEDDGRWCTNHYDDNDATADECFVFLSNLCSC